MSIDILYGMSQKTGDRADLKTGCREHMDAHKATDRPKGRRLEACRSPVGRLETCTLTTEQLYSVRYGRVKPARPGDEIASGDYVGYPA